MKYFDWSKLKNSQLKATRGLNFEDIQAAIEDGRLLADIDHPNQKRYPGQKIFIVQINNYVYLAPYIEEREKIFIKTIYASRKFTKKYLKEDKK